MIFFILFSDWKLPLNGLAHLPPVSGGNKGTIAS
jgi:hypothetical protein